MLLVKTDTLSSRFNMGRKPKWDEDSISSWIKQNAIGYTLKGIVNRIIGKGRNTRYLILKCPNPNHDEYQTQITNFLNGKRCPKCHKYDIEAVQNMVEGSLKVIDLYVLNNVKIAKIKCSHGHEYEKRVLDIRSGYFSCNTCNPKIWDKESIIFNLGKTHKDYEILSIDKTKWDYRVELKCEKGHIFKMSLKSLINGSKCSLCNGFKSKGETKIYNYLLDSEYDFESEFTFDDLKHKIKLRFDFAVFIGDDIKLIEFDGEQHFRPIQFGGMSIEKSEELFKDNVKRDEIKNKYCADNNIDILRIPYYEYDNIEIRIEEFLKERIL